MKQVNRKLLNVYVSEEVYRKLEELENQTPMNKTNIIEFVLRSLFDLPYKIDKLNVDGRKIREAILPKKKEDNKNESLSPRQQAIERFKVSAITTAPSERENLISTWQRVLMEDYKLLISEEELKEAIDEIKDKPQERLRA